jgi:hypothetical protein
MDRRNQDLAAAGGAEPRSGEDLGRGHRQGDVRLQGRVPVQRERWGRPEGRAPNSSSPPRLLCFEVPRPKVPI